MNDLGIVLRPSDVELIKKVIALRIEGDRRGSGEEEAVLELTSGKFLYYYQYRADMECYESHYMDTVRQEYSALHSLIDSLSQFAQMRLGFYSKQALAYQVYSILDAPSRHATELGEAYAKRYRRIQLSVYLNGEYKGELTVNTIEFSALRKDLCLVCQLRSAAFPWAKVKDANDNDITSAKQLQNGMNVYVLYNTRRNRKHIG